MILHNPEALFHAARAALEAEDWASVANMCDPASLSLFRSQALRHYLEPQPRSAITVKEYLKHAPDMPQEVAEYHVAQMQRYSDPIRQLEQDYPAVTSIRELRGMTAAEVFAAWLEGRSLRRQLQRLVEERSLPDSAIDETLRRCKTTDRTIVLGVVPDGERVAHVIYRADAAAEPEPAVTDPAEREFQHDMMSRSSISVLTCRRGADGGWRLIADYSLFGHGANVVAWSDHPSDDAV